MPGPKNNHINRDSYDGALPAQALPPVLPKQINAGDPKRGSPKPGTATGATINSDDFYE